MSLAVAIGPNAVSIYRNGEYFEADKSHMNYEDLMKELRKSPRDEEAIMALVSIPRIIAKYAAGRVEINGDDVLFRGQKVGGYMVEKLVLMAQSGDQDTTPWLLFMDSLMDNPNVTVRDDLFKWMEVGKMPITPAGKIIAFKKVRKDFTDVHTGRFNNSPGNVLEMDRSLCDENRNRTCSTGFHFCSAGYLSSFSGQVVVVVEVEPVNVTAIPTDYNNQKARCCKYEVVHQLTSESAARHGAWNEKPVRDLEDPAELPDILTPRPPSAIATEAPPKGSENRGTPTGRKVIPPFEPGAEPKKAVSKKTPAKKAPPKTPSKKPAKKARKAEVAEARETFQKAAEGSTKKPPRKRSRAKATVVETVIETVEEAAPVVKKIRSRAKKVVDTVIAAVVPGPSFRKRDGSSFTADQVRQALTESDGKVSKAAVSLGVSESTLRGWVKTLP